MTALVSQNSRFGAQQVRRRDSADRAAKTGSRLMKNGSKSTRARNGASWEYGVYFTASFLLFLPVVLVNRVLPKSLRPLAPTDEPRSILGETRALTNTVVPFVFMA